MKVTNNKMNQSMLKPETAKSQKADQSSVLDFNPNIGGLNAKKEVKNSARVDVSERAQLMQKAKDIASKTSVDEAKVARLQKLIDEGKYKVDADAVADRLVDAHMDFPE